VSFTLKVIMNLQKTAEKVAAVLQVQCQGHADLSAAYQFRNQAWCFNINKLQLLLI